MQPKTRLAAYGVDQLGALPDQQIARAEDGSARLRAPALHGNEPHGRPLGRLTDRACVGSAILLPLYNGFTYAGGMSRTSCSNRLFSRAQ